jgi:hypothetical protein
MRIQFLQGLAYKFEVLKCSVGLQPEFGFDHVNAPHRTLLACLGKRCMVLPAQVAFEPNQGVAHGAVVLALCLRQASEQYKTWSQFLAHALRHVMSRPQVLQGLLGKLCLLPLKLVLE